MNNRQISISVKYGNEIYKKKFLEHDALNYISFLEEFKLWYEIQNATDGEQPCRDEQNKDENE